MSESEIPDLLDRAAARVEVGAPPLGAMLRDAGRLRRRRRLGLVAVVASVATVMGGTAYVVGSADRDAPDGGVTAPDESVVQPEIPAGHRLVAIGRAAIAVPQEWAIGAVHCGTPERDTVVVDQYLVRGCLIVRPRGVESVEIGEGTRFGFEATQALEIDGQRAQLQTTACEEGGAVRSRGEVLCGATLRLPDLGVWFRAESSTQPEATARAKVEEILSHVMVLDDRVGVPGYQEISGRGQERGGELYAARLREVGLRAEVVEEMRPGMGPGFVLGVEPAPGTVVDPGSAVRITVTGSPDGPADEVSVGMNSDAKDWEPDELDSLQIRADPTVRIKVGDSIWSYAEGKRARTLTGLLDGDSLEIDGWTDGPNHPHSWRAVRPGRTTVTLTITAEGREVVLGKVTVVVEK